MNPLVLRAELLINQQRYTPAVEVLRDTLVRDPNNARVHSLLAISLAQTNQYDEATEHARQAIEQAPDSAQSHFSLAWVMVERRRWKEARQAIDGAISIAPEEARFYWMLSRILYCQCQWQQALQAAEQGMAIQPDDQASMNMRALCHLALGDKQLAVESARQSLERRPEDPWAHASQGWAHLTIRQSQAAMESFREALRLDPNLEWARQGMLEALRAKSWLYRMMVRMVPTRMKRLAPARFAWLIAWIAIWPFSCYLGAVVMETTPIRPWLCPTMAVSISLLGVLLASPIANLFLRVHPFGRHVLNKDEIRGANLLAACAVLPLPFLLAAMLRRSGGDLVSATCLWIMAGPASLIFQCPSGWVRYKALACCIMLLALGLLAALPIEPLLDTQLAADWRAVRGLALLLFLYGAALSSILLFVWSRALPRR